MVEQILGRTGDREAYFWATPAGAELDLLVFIGGRRIGFEIKYADAPRSTKSMAIAQQDLALDELLVVYPGETAYALPRGIEVVPIRELDARLDKLLRARGRPMSTPSRRR